jgi:hypothetical protein
MTALALSGSLRRAVFHFRSRERDRGYGRWMRSRSQLLQRGVVRFNACVLHWQASSPAVRRRLTVVTYVGRRSGRTFSTPVAYQRVEGGVVIEVSIPDRKEWWRNFTGEGGPITVRLDEVERPGHATATRVGGRVRVAVRFTD